MRRFGGGQPFAFPLPHFRPCRQYLANANWVDKRKNRGFGRVDCLFIAENAQAGLGWVAPQSCLFIGFDGCGRAGCGFVHRPALGQNPPSSRPTGDQANFNLAPFYTPAQGGNLGAGRCLLLAIQSQGALKRPVSHLMQPFENATIYDGQL